MIWPYDVWCVIEFVIGENFASQHACVGTFDTASAARMMRALKMYSNVRHREWAAIGFMGMRLQIVVSIFGFDGGNKATEYTCEYACKTWAQIFASIFHFDFVRANAKTTRIRRIYGHQTQGARDAHIYYYSKLSGCYMLCATTRPARQHFRYSKIK